MNAVSPPNSALADRGLSYLPIFMGIRCRTVLLIGGSDGAAAKLALLRQAGARVRLVAAHSEGAVDDITAADGMVSCICEPLAAHPPRLGTLDNQLFPTIPSDFMLY